MKKTNFRDLSSGYKVLVIVELSVYFGSVFLAILANNFFGWSQQSNLETNIVAAYSLVFALFILLTSLSLGLYNPRMRENYRNVFRRLVLAVALGSAEFAILFMLINTKPFTAEVVLTAAGIGLILTSLIRHTLNRFDLLGFNKINVLILGSGERASIVERRMRRAVDRHGFTLKGFVVMEGDLPDGIQRERRINLEKGALLSFVIEHNIDEIVVALSLIHI